MSRIALAVISMCLPLAACKTEADQRYFDEVERERKAFAEDCRLIGGAPRAPKYDSLAWHCFLPWAPAATPPTAAEGQP